MTDWYVVYTQPQNEARAVENLARQGFEAYLPTISRLRRHARRQDVVRRPLFPRYLFVVLDPERTQWRPILSTFGVADLIRTGDRPTPVPRGFVEALRQQEGEGAFDERLCKPDFRVGESVRINEGPFANLMAKVLGLKDDERVYVLLNLLGGPVKASVPVRALMRA